MSDSTRDGLWRQGDFFLPFFFFQFSVFHMVCGWAGFLGTVFRAPAAVFGVLSERKRQIQLEVAGVTFH